MCLCSISQIIDEKLKITDDFAGKAVHTVQWARFLVQISPKFTVGRIDAVRSTEEIERRRWFY